MFSKLKENCGEDDEELGFNTRSDVKNLKFDPSSSTPPLDRNSKREKKSVGSSIDISKGERMENHEKSLFKKPAHKGKQVMVEGNLAFDERERLKEMREKSILRRGGSWCRTRGERVMGEKTTPIKNPDG